MIDLNQHHIEAVIRNLEMKEVAIKLPNTEKGLKHSLRLNEIADEEEINYTNFEHKLKSVLYLYNIDTIKIEAPLNIFYLNLYLNLLKERNIELNTKEDEWNTEVIKSKIAELLNTDSMNYDDFVKHIKDTKAKEHQNKEPKEKEQENKPKKKPMFSIKEMQREHLERK